MQTVKSIWMRQLFWSVFNNNLRFKTIIWSYLLWISAPSANCGDPHTFPYEGISAHKDLCFVGALEYARMGILKNCISRTYWCRVVPHLCPLEKIVMAAAQVVPMPPVLHMDDERTVRSLVMTKQLALPTWTLYLKFGFQADSCLLQWYGH